MIEVLAANGPVLIGGYNPQSWSSSGSYNLTVPLSDRTGFIFNVTGSLLFGQSTTSAFGSYQTLNTSLAGPAFGNGADIYVDSALNRASSFLASYGNAQDFGKDISKFPNAQFGDFAVGKIEVFTIAGAIEISPIPEPQTYVLMLAGLAALAATARRRTRGTVTLARVATVASRRSGSDAA